MIAPFRDLQQLVLDASAESRSRSDVFMLRLTDALRALRNGGDVGPADVAALLRQGTIRCQALSEPLELRVPRAKGWPDEQLWRSFLCDVTEAREHYVIRPKPWKPTWLDDHAAEAVARAIHEDPRRAARGVPADPLITQYLGTTDYTSPGQREAVRAAFFSPAGGTTVVNLPTGAGKTLAFQLPALRYASSSELTLVLVPTVALARDQEERFRLLLEGHPNGNLWARTPLAYHSGLSTEEKRAVAVGVRGGTLPILFASPEAALGALRGPLFDAARHGRLRLFAVDEAHIVSQWGQQFRPEFQSVAGLRNALLQACPPHARFRTLLLTATLTSESLETLRLFFGHDCQIVSESYLRPEPSFLIRSEHTEVVRDQLVVESLRFLPRPLILYTTLRNDVEEWSERLRAAGFRRLRMVRGGDASGADGERLLRDWKSRAADVVVATSAFGLGMDLAEVRSIAHACLPESIDRYYQEVGRGGRDGHACVALLVSTLADVKDAEHLARERIISADRGFQRWEAMFRDGRPGDQGTHIVSLDARPVDIQESGPRNNAWNLRTLVLMARAHMLEFAAHAPPQIERSFDEEELIFDSRRQKTLAAFYREVAVHIHDSRHLDAQHWNGIVQRTRTELHEADEHSIELLKELRDLKRPVNELFREVYTIVEPRIQPPPFAGDCPVTRAAGRASSQSIEPDVVTITSTSTKATDDLLLALRPALDGSRRAWVSYEPPGSEQREARKARERVVELLRFLVFNGVVELCVPRSMLGSEDWSQLSERATSGFLARGALTPDPPFHAQMLLPRLTFLDPRDADATTLLNVMRMDRPCHVLVLPVQTRDPRHPARALFEVTNHITLIDLLERLRA